jgi:hypothetical protein
MFVEWYILVMCRVAVTDEMLLGEMLMLNVNISPSTERNLRERDHWRDPGIDGRIIQ